MGHKADELTFKDGCIILCDRYLDDFLFTVLAAQSGVRPNDITHPRGLEKFGRRFTENYMRVVDTEHGRIVRKAKDEAPVHQAVIINDHRLGGFEFDDGASLTELNRRATEGGVGG